MSKSKYLILRDQIIINFVYRQGLKKEGPLFDKENLFILMKILGERHSPNANLWTLVV